MNVSSQLLQGIIKGGTKAIPVIGQAGLGKQILGSISKQALGYDFVGLITKLGFFYVTAFILIKYFEAVIFGSGIIKTIGGVVGINLNPALPDSVVSFFKNGFIVRQADPTKNIDQLSIMPWDVVNIIGFLLVVAEATNYFEDTHRTGNKLSYITVGVWGLFISSMALISIVPLIQKFKGTTKMTAAQLVSKYGATLSSTTNFNITILNPTNNASQSFIMSPAQVASLPSNFYVTAGPVLTTSTPNLTDAMFTQLFGVPVGQ